MRKRRTRHRASTDQGIRMEARHADIPQVYWHPTATRTSCMYADILHVYRHPACIQTSYKYTDILQVYGRPAKYTDILHVYRHPAGVQISSKYTGIYRHTSGIRASCRYTYFLQVCSSQPKCLLPLAARRKAKVAQVPSAAVDCFVCVFDVRRWVAYVLQRNRHSIMHGWCMFTYTYICIHIYIYIYIYIYTYICMRCPISAFSQQARGIAKWGLKMNRHTAADIRGHCLSKQCHVLDAVSRLSYIAFVALAT